jgi:hypothetical protein
VLEPNWWETAVAQEEARVVADEVLRLDQERRMREDEGEEDQATGNDGHERDEKPKTGQNGKLNGYEEKEKTRVVARTRVSPLAIPMIYR